MKTTYSYSQKLTYFVNKSKNSVSAKQAWYFYGKAKNLAKWYELTDKQLEAHKEFLAKYAKSIENKFGSTTTQKPTASAPAPKLPKVVEPAVSKNGRTNNALRVKAVIANLEASIEILRAIK
jgi:hypothetical protein